jgi:putative glutamine amidotransferase
LTGGVRRDTICAKLFQAGATKMRPIVAVTRAVDTSAESFERYLRALTDAGAEPAAVAPGDRLPDGAAGILFTGGGDVNPAAYGEHPHPATAKIDDARDEMEMGLARRAYEEDVPVLAICRGIQMLAVAMGGTLLQDIANHRGAEKPEVFHAVRVEEGSLLQRSLAQARLERVSSSHHQAVNRPPEPFKVVAWSEDGIIEGMEAPGKRFIVGVQWHPERTPDWPEQRALITSFVAAAGGIRE